MSTTDEKTRATATCGCGKPVVECDLYGVIPDDLIIAAAPDMRAQREREALDDSAFSPPMQPFGRTTDQLLRDGWTTAGNDMHELHALLSLIQAMLVELKADVLRSKGTAASNELALFKTKFVEIPLGVDELEHDLTMDEWDATQSRFRAIRDTIDEIEELLADVTTDNLPFVLTGFASFSGWEELSHDDIEGLKATALAEYRSKTGYQDKPGTALQATVEVTHFPYGGGNVTMTVQTVEVPTGIESYPLPKRYTGAVPQFRFDRGTLGRWLHDKIDLTSEAPMEPTKLIEIANRAMDGPLFRRYVAGKGAVRSKAMVEQMLGEPLGDLFGDDPEAPLVQYLV